MKIERTPSAAVQSNSTSFKNIPLKIGDSKLVADLLRKHYQNPRRTMIQEYLSNARDAHREMNTQSKINVTLPTKASPNLIIRDFGPGLSDSVVEDYFCSYASSTKRDSEAQTGGFGIGCKSAWAYRDNFFVKNFNQGLVTLYEASTQEYYEGSLKVISQTKTTDHSGVEIIIPIKIEDIDICWKETFLITSFWNEINFTNTQEEEQLHLIDKVYEDQNLVVIKNCPLMDAAWGGGKNIKLAVLNDNLIYPIPSAIINKLGNFIRDNCSGGFTTFLKFNETKLKPTIARESLEDCLMNENLIQSKVKSAQDQFSLQLDLLSKQALSCANKEELKGLWSQSRSLILASGVKHKVGFKLGELDLGKGRITFSEIQPANGSEDKVSFCALGREKKSIRLNNKQSWYDLTTDLDVVVLNVSARRQDIIDLETRGPLMVIISNHRSEFLNNVKLFLAATDQQPVATLPVRPNLGQDKFSCEYLSCSAKNPKWSQKTYSVSQVLNHHWVDSSVKAIPDFFLVEMNKHLPSGHGLLLITPPQIEPHRERRTFDFYRNSPAWSTSLDFLLKSLAQATARKINILKKYKLLPEEQFGKVNLGLMDNPRIKSSNNWTEFSRIQDQVDGEFLKFLAKEDEESFNLINSILLLNKQITKLVDTNKDLLELFDLVNKEILPSNPSEAFLKGINLACQIQKRKRIFVSLKDCLKKLFNNNKPI